MIMDEIQKMFRVLINGQSALKQELLGEINKLRKDLGNLKKEMHDEFKKVHKRIDRIGYQLAYLEEDAPTREEYDELENRVEKIETKIAAL